MVEGKLFLNSLVETAEKVTFVRSIFNTQEKGELFLSFESFNERQDSFYQRMQDNKKKLPWSQVDQEIADWRYRKHVQIPLTVLLIRPFWRDGKQAPPLPYETRSVRRSHHW